MPIEKMDKKKSSTKAKVETKKVIAIDNKVESKKPDVIVETRKTSCDTDDKKCCCCKEMCLKSVIILLLLINVILTLINCLNSSKSARDLEVLKVGGKENMEMAEKFYNSDYYKQYQSEYIQSYLGQLQ